MEKLVVVEDPGRSTSMDPSSGSNIEIIQRQMSNDDEDKGAVLGRRSQQYLVYLTMSTGG